MADFCSLYDFFGGVAEWFKAAVLNKKKIKMINGWSSDYKSHQGNIGLGMAIAYYTSRCIPVMIPLNDTQKYDLVVDIDGVLKRVSVKTTQCLNKSLQHFIVQLKNSGGSSGNSKIRNFNKTDCDILFVLTKNHTMYEIPSDIISVHTTLTLTEDYDKYLVGFNNGTSAHLETNGVEEG